MNDTHLFVEKVMKMWHIMNIKVSNAGSNLNDRNRDVIRDPNDNRFSIPRQDCNILQENGQQCCGPSSMRVDSGHQ